MARLAPTTPEPPTRQQIEDRLRYWREHLREHQAGTNMILTRREIDRELDRWLDMLLELRGR